MLFRSGRPKGSRNKTTRKAQELLDRFGEAIMQRCMSMALQGDPGAIRLIMERLIPARRDGYVRLPLPRAKTVADVSASNQKVLQAIARGQVTPADGECLSRILEGQRRLIETTELAARIEALEQKSNQDREGGNP